MLTTGQKSNILAKIGVAVPAFPQRPLPNQERHLLKGAAAPRQELDADADQAEAVTRWARQVEAIYATFVAARAARSLREAQETQQNNRLRSENNRSSRNRDTSDTDFDIL